jgi:hypothetical protein
MRGTRRASAAGFAVLALLATATACTGSDDRPNDAATPGTAPSVASSAPATSPGPTGSTPASGAPSAHSTTAATPGTSLLSWTRLPGDAADTITSNGTWKLTVGKDSNWWSLGRGSSASAKRTKAPSGYKVINALLSDDFAVAIYGDPDGTKQERAVITALPTGNDAGAPRVVAQLDKGSDLPPSTDGSWALDGSTLWHATDHAGAYCLASEDLADGTSTLSWCAPARQGFTNIMAADGQTSMMTFDDGQPSCRSVVTVTGTTTTPYPDVPRCKGVEGAVLGSGSDTSTVWSMVPNEHRYQRVHVYASTPGGVVDLGFGVNSTLTVCGGAAYWARDAEGGASAALMRWDGARLSIAYESKGFLGKPLCAGHTLSILDSTDNGDQQLTATLS